MPSVITLTAFLLRAGGSLFKISTSSWGGGSTRQLVKLNKITNEIQGNLPILFIIYYAHATLRFSKLKLQTYPILRFHLS